MDIAEKWQFRLRGKNRLFSLMADPFFFSFGCLRFPKVAKQSN